MIRQSFHHAAVAFLFVSEINSFSFNSLSEVGFVNTAPRKSCWNFFAEPSSKPNAIRNNNEIIETNVMPVRRLILKESAHKFTVAAGLATYLGNPSSALAEDTESTLTTRMFNADGSLKDDTINTEAKFRSVNWSWSESENFQIDRDGKNGSNGKGVDISYKLPEKWTQDYIDTSEGVNQRACDSILVYQAAGKFEPDTLTKATRTGVAKALAVPETLEQLFRADLIGGRSFTTTDTSQKYYEFDMAMAPKTCEDGTAENLGLGFCPYDSVYLLAATITDTGRLYVLVINSTKNEWKRASSDLRRVRSSFRINSNSSETS